MLERSLQHNAAVGQKTKFGKKSIRAKIGLLKGIVTVKILVAVKQVIDYRVKIRVKTDKTGVVTDAVKMSINPFDEIAVEAALRLKEQNLAQEVIVVSCGTPACQDVLRAALALGADRGILVLTEHTLEPIHVAQILQVVIKREQVELVFLGKQAIDDDCNQTGQMLAGYLDWPQGTFVSRLTIDGQQIVVVREIDGGLETLQLRLPAIITTDLGLNQPRYASLPNIMRAKQKPIQTFFIEELGILIQPHVQILEVASPKERKAGIKVDTIGELMKKLQEDQRVSL